MPQALGPAVPLGLVEGLRVVTGLKLSLSQHEQHDLQRGANIVGSDIVQLSVKGMISVDNELFLHPNPLRTIEWALCNRFELHVPLTLGRLGNDFLARL